MRRLYTQIYLTLAGTLVLFGMLIALTWWLSEERLPHPRLLDGLAAIASELFAEGSGAAPTQQRLEHIAKRLGARLSLYSADRRLIAAAGEPLPPPGQDRSESGWTHTRGGGPAWTLRLSDGKWLTVKLGHEHWSRAFGFLVGLLLLAVAVAIAARPLVRRLTRRLERLQAQVEALGAGDLGARVQVEGRDEIGRLAGSFNEAAARIEQLVQAQKTLLASASHELRTPLARIRMAAELLGDGTRPDLQAHMERNIHRLDDLIAELLLASRLDLAASPLMVEEVDLLALVAEEASRYEASVKGEPAILSGDAGLLRHLVRNLLENARRHAAGSGVEVTLGHSGGRLLVSVCDRGPGVPESERERIFDPFYRPVGQGEATDGVGLGLYLVRRIAEIHGGAARCRPHPGGGSCFEVELGSSGFEDA